MTVLMLLVSILLTTILLALPGLAPYLHGFVSVAKYPAYAYFTWKYAPLVLYRLVVVDGLASRMARSLVHATFSLSIWVVREAVTRSCMFTPILAGLKILAGCWQKVIALGPSVQSSLHDHLNPFVVFISNVCERVARCRSCVLGYIDRVLVGPCSKLASIFWTCALSHGMSCVVISGFDITTSYSIRSFMASYPLSFIVGLLNVIILWRCVLKTLLLGGLGVHMLAYVYLVTISGLARSLLSLKAVYLTLLSLTLGHMFAMKDFSERELASLMKCTILAFILHEDILVRQLCDFGSFLCGAFRKYALRLVRLLVTCGCTVALWVSLWVVITGPCLLLRRLVRLLLKHIFVPVVRLILFKTVCWACMACTIGCMIAATITIELFAALLVPVHYAHLLLHRWYKSSEVHQPLVLSVEHEDLPPVSSEELLSSPPSPSRSSHPTTSEGIRRLGRFINAYLDECSSAGQVVELEGQFTNTPSMHAPPPSQTTPPTPLFSLPATPVPGSPILSPASPVEATVTGDPSPKVSFEPAGEGEEVVALAERLSRFHIEFEASLAPRRSRSVSQRSKITFEAYERSLGTPLATSPREGWTDRKFEGGCVDLMQMRK